MLDASDNASDLMKVTINANTKGGWKQRTEKLEKELNIETRDYNKSKQAFKTDIGKKINKKFTQTIEEKGKSKSKVQHLKHGQPDWKPGSTKEHMIKLPEKEASTIFKAKTRIIKVKCNYKNMFKHNH